VVMSSNLHLFREMRQSEVKLGEALSRPRAVHPM
jgi:hypothetical protein